MARAEPRPARAQPMGPLAGAHRAARTGGCGEQPLRAASAEQRHPIGSASGAMTNVASADARIAELTQELDDLRSRHEAVADVLRLARREVRPFDDGEIELMATFADQSAIAIANAKLFETVERQKGELARFLSPEVAALISSDDGAQLLAGHRAYITVVYFDLRGFTAFAETAEPEELIDVVREYHTVAGELVGTYGGTLEHFAGDGLMVFFNDPVTMPEHELRAARLAIAMRERIGELARDWRKRGYELGLGAGIAVGHATLGRIGFEGRYDYGALGTVTNLDARLSDEAGAG